MATLSVKVKNYRSKAGTYQVAIGLSHRQKTCYIPTPIAVSDPSHVKGLSIVKEKDFVEKTRMLNELLDKYSSALNRLNWIEDYTCTELKDIITTNGVDKRKRFVEVANERIEIMSKAGSSSHAEMHKYAIVRWEESIGDILLSHITPQTINKYHAHLRDKNYSEATIAMSLRQVKTFINYAIKCQYVRYEVHPFINTVIPRSPSRDLPLELETFQKIYNFKPVYNNDTIARDLFLLSFFTGGANLADIVRFNYKKGDEVIRYVRTKTNGQTKVENVVVIPVIDDARPILDKYVKKSGGLDFGYDYSPKNFTSFISKCMKTFRKRLDVDDRLVLYSARKGFAQYALDLEISDSVVDYCLGHSNSSRGIISYYSKVKVKQAHRCLETVADYATGRKTMQEILKDEKTIK